MVIQATAETEYFYKLTPERVLSEVERALKLQATGRWLTLNSMENRVYSIELEDLKGNCHFVVAKFYRPGRWTLAQLQEEHRFCFELTDADIPVVAPLVLDGGNSIIQIQDLNIYFCLYPRVGGRSVSELSDNQLEQAGRLLARIHTVGAQSTAPSRLRLDHLTYGKANLQYLADSKAVPDDLQQRYQDLGAQLCEIAQPLFKNVRFQRIHGDCHIGNLLDRDGQLCWVDFDDMVQGPCVQDIWLLVPGRDDDGQRQRDILLGAYESMHDFDWHSLKLVEVLRGLRFIHFSAWISKRWQDPAFPPIFPNYASRQYWYEQIADLEEVLQLLQQQLAVGY